MSQGALWNEVRVAWALLAGRREHHVEAGRSRETPARPMGDEPALATPGFAEEALPWLDAVYRFSLRLTRGDVPAAEDLAQDTFLRAQRFWHTFTPGTNAKSWLFTICHRQFIQERRSAKRRVEDATLPLEDNLYVGDPLAHSTGSPPDDDPFDGLLDEEVVQAIDALPDGFREVLILSDLGDLQYQEIAEVLELPIGTVRSRLFRARCILQGRLLNYAQEAGVIARGTPEGDTP